MIRSLFTGLILLIVVACFFLWVRPPVATAQVSISNTRQQQNQTDDAACRLCHEDTEGHVVFPSGEVLPASVGIITFTQSAHGMIDNPLSCTSCHNMNDYRQPHTGITASTQRAYEIEQAQTCVRCHNAPHPTNHPSLESDNPVVCTDCHGSHEAQTVATWSDEDKVSSCTNCHKEDNPTRFLAVIEAGLFAKESTNDTCLACHSQSNMTMTFDNGDEVSVTIDAGTFHDSVHGESNSWQSLACIDCHREGYDYPHAPQTSDSYRDYSLEMYTLCIDCHENKYELTVDGVHQTALDNGNKDAAICTDCHGAHDTISLADSHITIATTCGECHTEVFEEYAGSIHGEALLNENNSDVPTCINCHGVHSINDPLTNAFRVRSPQLCAECHADEELMTQYDISTDVFETYVADFHGTTVTLFEEQSPDAETNKAVCYDCHGVHNTKATDDPHAGIKDNLLETCQQCHPDATESFPNAWTSHFQPSLEHNPLVYLVNLFYQIVIPLTVGFFAFLVSTDVYRRVRMKTKGRDH